MRLRNALKIAIANNALVIKNLIYKLVIFAVFSLCLWLTLKFALKEFIIEVRPVLQSVWQVVLAIINGENHEIAIAGLNANFAALRNYVSNHIGSLVWTAVVVVFFFILYRFFVGIGNCTLMILINGHMTDMSHRGFIVVMIENFKKIVVYQLIDAVSSAVWSAFVCVLVWGVFNVAKIIMPIAALFSCALTISLAMSFYCTVFSQVMANVLIGEQKSLKRAILDGFAPKKKYFVKMFSAYFAVTVGLIYLHVSVSFFTLGVGELITIPFASLLLVTMKTVDYFTIHKKKYFVDYDTIVVPKELRENDEKLLSDIDI